MDEVREYPGAKSRPFSSDIPASGSVSTAFKISHPARDEDNSYGRKDAVAGRAGGVSQALVTIAVEDSGNDIPIDHK